MAKWGIWAAHRYVSAGAAAPREYGADGRTLQRPWRLRDAERVMLAARRRAARAQPRWPRLLGWLCIGVAVVAAAAPVGPLPSDGGLSAAGRPGPEATASVVDFDAPQFEPATRTLRWRVPVGASGPFTVLLLGADYRPLARRDGIAAASCVLSGELLDAVKAAGAVRAVVLARLGDRIVRSLLAGVEIR